MPKKSATRFKIDDAVFQSKIRKMAKRAKVDEFDFVKQQGALYAIDFAKYAPPYVSFPSGNISKRPVATDADIDQGEMAILNDCKRIFRAKPRGYIVFLAKEYGRGMVNTKRVTKRGRVSDIEYAAIGMDLHDMYKFHERMMQPSGGRTSWRQDINSMWVPDNLFEQYVEWRSRNIGLAKATLIKAARKINPKVRTPKTPAKVRKMVKKATARGGVFRKPKGAQARFTAIAYGLQHLKGHVGRIQRGRMKAMETRLLYLVKASAKKSGFKVR